MALIKNPSALGGEATRLAPAQKKDANNTHDTRTVRTFGSPFTVPQILDHGKARYNKSYDWLRNNWGGKTGVAMTAPGTNADTPSFLKPSNVTENNYQELAKKRFEQKARQFGRPLENGEKLAILDTYRQMAGLEPRMYSVSKDGAKPRQFGSDKSVGLLEGFSDSVTGAAKFSGDAISDTASGVKNIASSASTTLNLGFLAIIIGGIAYLWRG